MESRISLTLFWSESLISFASSSLVVVSFHKYELTLTRNYSVAEEEFQLILTWFLNESDDYFWLFRRRCPTRVNKTCMKEKSKKRKSSKSYSKLYRITQETAAAEEPGREETKTARAVFVKFIFHRGYNFSNVKI